VTVTTEQTAAAEVDQPPDRWWVSWYSAPGPFEYHGPWWITGQEIGGAARRTIVAAVLAPSADDAKAIIHAAHDEPRPTVIDWRFVTPQPADWSPFGERFPRADWMRWPDPAATDPAAGEDRAEFVAAVQAQAFTDTDSGRRIIHCLGAFTGADWDADDVVDTIEHAVDVQWIDGGGHDLAALTTGKRIWRFGVRRP
jgi:hypothetical protein